MLKKTVDVLHTSYMTQVIKGSELVRELQDQRRHLLQQLMSMDNDVQNKVVLQDRLYDVERQIKSIKQDVNEVDYMTNNADILFNYYDLVDSGKLACSPAQQHPADHHSILTYFQSPSEQGSEGRLSGLSRGNLLERYMSQTDSNFVPKPPNTAVSSCAFCKSKDVCIMVGDSYQFCNQCHTVEPILTSEEKPSYRDPPKEITYWAYKRGNHLSEWLAQVQGKETTDIPDEIYDRILVDIKKQRIDNMSDVSPKKVKDILKRLKLNKYYEHIPQIVYRLSGQPMPNFPAELEERLKNMFKMVQTPFLKHSPKRKNFLSYSYCLRKLLQLLGEDEYMSLFGTLKSNSKLYEQEMIWKKICEELNWEFIPLI